MKKISTFRVLGVIIIFVYGTLGISNLVDAQNCAVPNGLNTTNASNFSTTANWSIDNSVDHYRLRYKEIGTTNWLFEHNILSSSSQELTGLTANTTYIWQLKAYCSVGNSNTSSWSVVDSFLTTNYTVDCYNTPNGTAYIDSCGNCVEGMSGNLPCIAFSPSVAIALSTYECNSVTDIVFSTSQDPNEPDISSSVFSSDRGGFDFTGLSQNDTVGSGIIIAGGGYINISTTLLVDFFITNDKISIKVVDNISANIYGAFTIENAGGGVLVVATSLPDNNNVTSGNSQVISLEGLFVNPLPSVITFTSTINSELGDINTQFTQDTIACYDCNNEFGGTAYIDSCGNCVGGNTGNVACIDFTPTVTVNLSNTDCDSLSDLIINVSQDPNEPDMSTSLFVSDGGYFAISTMTVGDTIGTALMQIGLGLNFNTILIVNSIISINQAIIQSKDIITGLVLGTFTISNSNPGVNIIAQSIPDNNNVTSGNTQTVTFNNVFVNPGQGVLTFTSTINSELGDVDIQTFQFSINCLCIPNSSTDSITACDSYTWINGVTYTSSNYTATQILTNGSGCDSTVFLSLTINYSTSSTTIDTACDSYTWNGQVYTQSGTYVDSSTNASGCLHVDSLVLTIDNSTSTSMSATACDSYTWNGQVYTQSGTYVDSSTNASGCLHVDSLVLTIDNSTFSVDSITACDEYTWTDGGTYTQSGVYIFNTQNTSGCDSTATLNLTINYSTLSSTVDTACDSYTWLIDGQTYTQSGTYVDSSTNAAGCLHVENLVLTINNSTTSTSTVTECDSYTWSVNGQTYTQSGTYTSTSTNVAGCTHIDSLVLTINNSTFSVDSITACDSYTWIDGVTYTSSNYTATQILTNGSGCDSTVFLSLTINSSDTTSSSFTACDSYTWDGTTYTSSGAYTNVYTNAAGCDSTHTLNLTINNSTTSTSTATACDTYTWSVDGQTYTQSGTYVDFSTNASGCLHVDSLVLTIDNSTSTSMSATACDSYTWLIDGQTYTQSGTYVDSSTNASGCLHVDSLVLTINNSTTSSQNVVLCNGDSVVVGNNVYTISGVYFDTLTAVNGCDSVITTVVNAINLYVSLTPTGPINLCLGDSVNIAPNGVYNTYQWNNDSGPIIGATTSNFTATASGNYSLTVTNINSCSATSTPVSVTFSNVYAPVNLTTSNISFTSAVLNFDNVLGVNTYDIRYREAGGLWVNEQINVDSLLIDSLLPTTNYEWQVRSICPSNSGISSSWSATEYFTTLTCSDITGLFVNNIQLNKLTLNWAASSTADHYDVLIQELGSTSWNLIPYIYATQRIISGLTHSTSYIWKVRGVCSIDSSVVSNWSSADTVSTLIPCTTPLNPSSNVGLTSAVLNWDVISGSWGYRVKYKESGGSWIFDTITTNSLSLIALSSATNYIWKVQGFCDSLGINNSPWTSLQYFTTLSPCADPNNLLVNNVTAFTADVSWSASSASLAYEVYYSVQGSGIWDTLTTNNSSITIIGLLYSTTYDWKVMSICALGGINNSNVISGTSFTIDAQCTDPSNLSVTAITSSEATFNWDAIPGVDHYELRFREAGTSTWITFNAILSSTISKTVTGLNLATTYEWEIRSVCDQDGNNSNWVVGNNFTTLSCPVPTSPITTNILLDRATLNWTGASGAHHYEIRVKAITSGSWQVLTEYNTSRTKTGLSPSTNYHWQVRTICNAAGTSTSNWSDTVVFQTMTPCTVPINAIESSIGLDFATLTWDANPTVIGFIVKYRKLGGVWQFDTTSTNSITISSLDHSSIYNWRVKSMCDSAGNNNSAFTPIIIFNTLVPCANPSALSVDSVGVNEAYLSWTPPAGTDHTVVRYSLDGSGVWNFVTTINSNIILNGLATYDDYIWEIITFCDSNGLNNSDTISGPNFSTANPCTVPTGVITTNILLDRVTFNWNAVALAHHYEIRWRVLGSATWSMISNLNGTSRIKTGMSFSTTYEWEIRSICTQNGSSFSDWSVTQIVTTLTPCTTPTNPISSNLLLTSAQLDWDVVPGAIAYRVRYRETGGSWVFDTANTNTILIIGLSTGTNYQWQVKSMCEINGNNSSSWTAFQTFTTLDLCTAPTLLSVAQITLNSVKFVIYGPSNPDHYYVLYRETTSNVWDTATITSADITGTYAAKVVTGLTAASTYEWQVQASCQAGDINLSPFTTGPNFTTLTPCDIPTNLSYSINGQDVTFTWDAVIGAVSYTAKYRELGNTLWQTATITNPTYTANNLGYGIAYEWAISSNCDYNGVNSSSFSIIDTFNTASCPDPLNISMSNITTSSVTVNWTNNLNVHHYALRGRETGTSVWTKNIAYIYGGSRIVNGLNAGVSYEFQIRSACTSDTSNVSTWSALQSVTTLVNCDANPSNLNETNITLTTADLSFTGTINALAYIVRLKPSSASGSAWIYDTLTAPNVSLSKSGLSANTYYSWQAKSVCNLAGSNTSAWTVQNQFSTLTPCQNPINLNVFNNQTTTSSFKVAFTSYNASVNIVIFKDSTVANWDTLSISGSSVTNVTTLPFGVSASAIGSGSYTTLLISGLSAGTTYEWQVMTQCAVGGTNNSAFVSGPNITTIPPCATPTGLTTSAITATNATANWSATSTAHHYDVRGRIVGTSGWSINITYQYNTTRIFSGLTIGSNYEWQVRSVCSSDTSEVSAWSSLAIFSTMVSCDNAPSNLNETNITLTTATLNWDIIQPNAQLYQIRLKQSNQGGSAWVYSIVSSLATSLNTTGLSANTEYNWQIRAVCDTVNSIVSPWSSGQIFTTDATCQIPNALQVRGNQTTLTSVSVRWLSQVNTSLVMFREIGISNWDTISVSGSTVTNVTLLPFGVSATTTSSGQVNDVVFTGLTSATSYEWQVIAYCSSYNQSISVNGPNFTTLTGCEIPTGLSFYPATTSAQVSWLAVSGAVKYELRKREQGTAWGNNIIEYSTSRNFTGFTPGLTYEWEIRSHCDNSGTNISAWSATQSFTTQALCTTPTNPTEINLTSSSVGLVWDSLPGAYSYKIKYRKIPGPQQVVIAYSNLLPLTSLDPGSSYKWKVKTNCDSLLTNVSPFTQWQYFNTLSSIRITAGDTELIDNLNVYPNPTRGLFNISFIVEEIDNFEITIVDAFGKLISQEEKQDFIGEFTKQVDLSDFPRGIYMVQIRTNDSFVSKRIVLQ